MNPKVTSEVSSLVAALVPIANAVFHWNLKAGVVLGIVVPLVGLALAEVGHAAVSASKTKASATTEKVA